MVQILNILEIAPPFQLTSTPIPGGADVEVVNELILETPTFLISGKQVDISTGRLIQRNNLVVSSSISTLSLNSKVFNNPTPITFRGDISIDFTSKYPLKTYNNIMTNDNLIVGEP